MTFLKSIQIEMVILNCNNIPQYYYLCCFCYNLSYTHNYAFPFCIFCISLSWITFNLSSVLQLLLRMYGVSLCWRSFGVSGIMCCNPDRLRKTEDREQTNWPSMAPNGWRSPTGDTVSLLTPSNRQFVFTFKLLEEIKYVDESMMARRSAVFSWSVM